MTEYARKCEQIENELAEIASRLTALGDMIPSLFLSIEEMESGTPKGVRALLTDIRKRVDDLRKYVEGNLRKGEAGYGG